MKLKLIPLLITVFSMQIFAQSSQLNCVEGVLDKNFKFCYGDIVYWTFNAEKRKTTEAKVIDLDSRSAGTIKPSIINRTYEVIPVMDLYMTKGCLQVHNKMRDQVCVGDRVYPLSVFSNLGPSKIIGIAEGTNVVVRLESLESDSSSEKFGLALEKDEWEFIN